ncbi:Uncharacterised protein [Acinetobacter baumannii]|nr:Uncharacterised protein [Acinetobacter baumannii]
MPKAVQLPYIFPVQYRNNTIRYRRSYPDNFFRLEVSYKQVQLALASAPPNNYQQLHDVHMPVIFRVEYSTG